MTNDAINHGRRRVLTLATVVVGGAGAVGAAVPFVGSWSPSAKAKAAGAPVEVNISKIEPGQKVTVEWRGMPVFVVRRTKEALDGLKVAETMLRDPSSEKSVQPAYAKNEYRTIAGKEDIAVLLGVCTHLGCAPEFKPEIGSEDISPLVWQGGFFCKCHGSKYDLAGRVFQGVPAPLNLPVPAHKYISDTVILIGEDQGA